MQCAVYPFAVFLHTFKNTDVVIIDVALLKTQRLDINISYFIEVFCKHVFKEDSLSAMKNNSSAQN